MFGIELLTQFHEAIADLHSVLHSSVSHQRISLSVEVSV